jgi:hypothetical protein
MKQVPPNTLDFPVNLTIIWCFMLSVCEMMHFLYVRGKNSNTYTENIRFHHTKCSHLGPNLLEKKTFYILASKYRLQAAHSLQFQFIYVINYSLQRSSKSYALSRCSFLIYSKTICLIQYPCMSKSRPGHHSYSRCRERLDSLWGTCKGWRNSVV